MSFFEDNLGLQTESSEKFEFEIVMLPLAASVERFRGWRKPFATTKRVLSLCPIIRAEKSITMGHVIKKPFQGRTTGGVLIKFLFSV